ncbi:MAG: cation-transporting P-type ATPase [Candidatus Anstonellales archaeon]
MAEKGLTLKQVEQSRERHGRNIIEERQKTLLHFIADQFRNTVLYLLIAAVAISFFIGEELEAIGIGAAIVLTIAFGTYLEYTADRSVRELKKYMAEEVVVIRDGKRQLIKAEELVVGDAVLMEEGQRVAADMKLISGFVEADESLLTGESKPVEKKKGDLLFSGSRIVEGSGTALVTAVGPKSSAGRIAGSLGSLEKEKTNIEAMLEDLGRKISYFGIAVMLFTIFISLLAGKPIEQAFLFSIALAVAVVPEGLVTVLTIVLALGVREMANHMALVKKMRAVEEIGHITALVTDKTGTLTYGKMKLAAFIANGKRYPPAEIPQEWKEAIAACTQVEETDKGLVGNETDRAIVEGLGISLKGIKKSVVLLRPFSSTTRSMSVKYKGRVITKGAPESVGINASDYESLGRVLGIKYGRKEGIIILEDPIREQAPEAVRKLQQGGVKVIVVTGDALGTASAVADKVGISGKAVLWEDIRRMDDEKLAERLGSIGVIARCPPEGKLRVVEALLRAGERVAVSGDGVNDALALKRANVSLVMGSTGTAVSKEIADIVLLDDNMSTIEGAVNYGKLVYRNVLNFIRFQLTTNVALVAFILLSFFFSQNYPLTALQLLFINIIVDGPPALALGFERSEAITEKPKLDRKLARSIILAGLFMAILSFIWHAIAPYEKKITYAFLSIASLQLFHAFNCRSMKKSFYEGSNNVLLTTFVVIMVVLVLTLFDPIAPFFSTVQLSLQEIALIFISSTAVLGYGEIEKLFLNKNQGSSEASG